MAGDQHASLHDGWHKVVPMEPRFVFGVDLDGVVADFYAGLRPIAAEWLGRPIEELTPCPSYNLPEWGLKGRYNELHRFAVRQRNFFEIVKPMPQAPQVLRRLSDEHVRIRVITHRLYIKRSHEATIQQTVKWLDQHDIPYWDLCFQMDKTAVGADLYVDDSPSNIKKLRKSNHDHVIVFSNSTNKDLVGPRASNWEQVGTLVEERLVKWYKESTATDRLAMYNLGVMYGRGRGVLQDDAEALSCYQSAAEKRVASAQHNLGLMYHHGRGTQRDDVVALMWLELAAPRSDNAPAPGPNEDRKCELSDVARDTLATHLTPAQIAEAQRRAREWDAAHPPREP